MELPIELQNQHKAALAAEAERAQWAYALAYVRLHRRKMKPKAREVFDRKLDTAASITARNSTLTTGQLQRWAARLARTKRGWVACIMARAAIKRIVKTQGVK